MNANRFNVLKGFLLPLMLGLHATTLISGTYLYLDNADLRKANEDIFRLLTDLKQEIKNNDFDKKKPF